MTTNTVQAGHITITQTGNSAGVVTCLPTVDTIIRDERLKEFMPSYTTPESAGVDLRACVDKTIALGPDETILVDTGMSIHINNPKLAGFIFPRSGLGHRNGIILGNSTGVIDSDYQGNLMVSLWNRTNQLYEVKPMDRIAQLVFIDITQVHFRVVESFDKTTERGEGGFGSTGL
jgi:dUTP pyrophosphatase